jgi:RNA polymerase sigma factor (TIGR02999 family)
MPRSATANTTANPDLTELLQAWSGGDSDALEKLAPLVHCQLREIARRLLSGESSNPPLFPTELVQESFVRMLDWQSARWENRAHFFATTARLMRRVLVDCARARMAEKRGAGMRLVSLDGIDPAAPARHIDLVALEDALNALAAVAPRPSQVVEMRFFGGFTVEETAEALDVSPRTVINDWNTARAWLYRELARRDPA